MRLAVTSAFVGRTLGAMVVVEDMPALRPDMPPDVKDMPAHMPGVSRDERFPSPCARENSQTLVDATEYFKMRLDGRVDLRAFATIARCRFSWR
jgi:hypothetical protein